MRKKLFTLLLAVAASVGTMFAWDYERVQIGDLYYNLDATNHTAEVTYKSYTNYGFNEGWGITTANIPASVTYNEITYSVTSIGMYAFYGCTGLTSITNYATTPQVINANVFNGVNKSTCMLYVPAESIAAYQAAEVWKEFGNIVPIEGTGEQEQGDAFNLIGITADRINVNSFGDKGTYSMNWIDIPSVNYIDTLRNDMTVTIEGIENFALQYKGKPRDNILKFGPDYLQVDGKNVVLCFSNVSVGDSVILLVSVKGSSDATFTVLNGAEPQDYVITRYADNVGDYVEISFIAISDYVEIKETTGGFRIKNVEVKSPATPAPCVLASGTCGAQGDNLTWTLTCDSVLTISGTGAMADYMSDDDTPWSSFRYTHNISVVIEDGVTCIGSNAFAYYGHMKNVTIPSTVLEIGSSAFISSATAFNVDEANPNYSSVDGVLFNKDQTTLLYYPVGKTDTHYTIPNTVNTISHAAFYIVDSLTSLDIPNSVTTIEEYAFRYCRALTSVSIPNSVLTIGYDAFEYCDNLVTVDISSSVISISSGAFAGNKKLQAINVDEANPYYSSIDGVLFNKDQTILVQYPLGKEGTQYSIPNTVTTLGSMSFSYFSKDIYYYGELTSIVIPNSVTTIANSAFSSCSAITSLVNYASTPQVITSNVFSSINKSSCTLYVPAESIELYRVANGWKEFSNILPIEGSGNPDPEETGCIDYLNLNNAVCYVNNSAPANTHTFNDFRVVQPVDNGPAQISSRHTVHFDRSETEPRTGGQAKTIPDGELASVRLGNWDSNDGAERIEYTFEVDTARPILLIKYLPLLEAPGHYDYENPRFTIDMLINGQSLGPCSMIDINANDVLVDGYGAVKPEYAAQGWHKTSSDIAQTMGDIVWKEWSTIGINLSDPMYQGQSLTIRLTTHDCVFSAHSGYAYFTLGCSDGKLTSTEYGSFTAPEGFEYRWMYKSSEKYRRWDGSVPEEYILSRDRQFEAGMYNDSLFVVDCMSVQDSTCFFTLETSLSGGSEGTDPDTPSQEERKGQSTEGKDFWVTFMQADQDPNNDLVLSLSISSREDCQVMIANPYTGYMETVNVTANQMQLVELYSGNVLLANARTTMANSGKVCYAGYSEQVDTCALHIMATSDISLFATNYKRATFDATNVLPTNVLGDEYIIQTYTPSDHGGVDRSQGSHFAIIATEDSTVVDYCPTVMTPAVNNAIAMYEFTGGVGMTPEELARANWQVGDTLYTPVLMAGQVFYVWTGKKDGETGDLSGTYVKARDGKRIAVFQGNPHTNIPYQVKQRDQLYSQAMPVRYWGTTFALTASAERPSDIIRVMALVDGTEVHINGEPVHTFDFTVDTKHYWEFEIGPSGTYAQEGSCMLTTSQPVAVHLFLTSQQYKGDKNSNGDPAMLWVSPIEQQMEQVNFVTYNSINGTYSNYLNVVTDQPSGMTLDNTSITSHFSPVSGSNTYYYAQIALGSDADAHTLKCNGGRFNAHVYGFTSNESYGYSVGGFIEDLTLQIYINGEPVSPVNDMCVGDTLFMDITTSFDYQSMKLDFGDGTVVYATDEEGIHARHAYDAPGVYHANVVVASNNNRLDSIPIRIIAGPLSLTYEPLNDIYVGDSIFYIYYHSPIQEMQIEEDFTIDRSFNDAALQDGFGHYTTRLNRSFFGVRIPEGARVGVEYAFNVDIHTLCGDYTATIPFVLKARRTGSCGDNMALTWNYDPETKTLTITGDGALNSNYTFGLEAPLEMEQLIIAEGVTSIGANAFGNMRTLQTMQLPASLKTIGASAFENDINLTAIYNYRERPCLVDATAFNGVNKFDCTLYVLEGSVDMYKSSISDWKDFYFILPIGTTEVTEPVSDVTVEPHDNSATVTWPTNDNAATYTIQITKDGVLFCTLIFNANGQLTGIAFAPSRNGQAHAPAALMTANGLQFTVTGLNSGTQYGYSVTAKDANDQPVATYSGEFTTTSEGTATGIEEISSSLQGGDRGRLILVNGQILILRGERTYTLTGAEVK